MRYRYKARRMDGALFRGSLEAADSRELVRYLESQGLFCCGFKVCGKHVIRKLPVKSKILPPFCRQISAMLSAGVPISHILDISCKTTEDKRLKRALSEVRESVQRGLTFSEAMEASPGSFPEFLINMAKAGEASGRLEEILDKMADYYSREEELAGKVREAMIYPFILLSVTLFSSVFLLTTVLPQFELMLEGQPIPPFTRLILDAANHFSAYGCRYFVSFLLLVVLSVGALNIPFVRQKADQAILSLPMIGKLIKIVYTSRFANAFSVVYGGGSGVLEALSSSAGLMKNTHVRKCLKEAEEGLKRGELLSQALKKTGIFHPAFLSMTAAGEESGSLEKVLCDTGIYYGKEAERTIRQMIVLLEPAMVLLMALIVGSMVMAVMVPVFTMYSSMM